MVITSKMKLVRPVIKDHRATADDIHIKVVQGHLLDTSFWYQFLGGELGSCAMGLRILNISIVTPATPRRDGRLS